MKIITVGLAITFFIMAFMIIAGSLNLLNSAKFSIEDSNSIECIGFSYTINYIDYQDGVLSFTIKDQKELSTQALTGIGIRPNDNEEIVNVEFDKPISKGISKRVYVNVTLNNDEFFVSPLSCSSEYEKRCYISKGSCD